MIKISCEAQTSEARKQVVGEEIQKMNTYLGTQLNMNPMMRHEAAMLREYLMAKMDGKIDPLSEDEAQS